MAPKSVKPPPELLEQWRREDERAREIRRKHADWTFINQQPPRVRLALITYIETGNLYLAAKLLGVTIDEFNQLRIRAKIPWVS